ncbi:hypothetical protein CDAR_86841 [Caerostris darwini]|uniref:Uncharacterized protein n=1 Tax=Caerostris darwini TaxID=1538125 RepID=A0AAV4VPF7_9ARAC|nr:hypothetical protein CDAR_86841 [Caerostris darwini]
MERLVTEKHPRFWRDPRIIGFYETGVEQRQIIPDRCGVSSLDRSANWKVLGQPGPAVSRATGAPPAGDTSGRHIGTCCTGRGQWPLFQHPFCLKDRKIQHHI